MNPRSALAQPFNEEATPRGDRSHMKFVSLGLLAGLGCAMIVSQMRDNAVVAQPAATMAVLNQPLRTGQFVRPAQAWGARKITGAATASAGVADKVNTVLKENFPDATDLNVKFHGSSADKAHLSVDFEFQLEDKKTLEPAL